MTINCATSPFNPEGACVFDAVFRGSECRGARTLGSWIIHVDRRTTDAEPRMPFAGMRTPSADPREHPVAASEFFAKTKTVLARSTA